MRPAKRGREPAWRPAAPPGAGLGPPAPSVLPLRPLVRLGPRGHSRARGAGRPRRCSRELPDGLRRGLEASLLPSPAPRARRAAPGRSPGGRAVSASALPAAGRGAGASAQPPGSSSALLWTAGGGRAPQVVPRLFSSCFELAFLRFRAARDPAMGRGAGRPAARRQGSGAGR